ncbi:hypothetical protein Tco_0032469 [Tanacetum coccineum]
MNTLAEHMIVVGVDNRPPMLEKSMYNSWQSQGPLVYPTIEENGNTRPKKHAELSEDEKLQDDCDLRAKNIVLQGHPSDIYTLERECKLYNDFDKFASVKSETLYEYYMRFPQLMNDIHNIGMTMKQVQVNTKFLNGLQPEWSKFVSDVKLAKSMYTTNYDQLYAYFSQHEAHVIEVRLMKERYPDPIAFVANYQ